MNESTRHSLKGPYRRLIEQYDTLPVFEVSPDLRFTRNEAIEELQCANWVALKKLEKLLKKLRVRTPRQLFMVGPKKLVEMDGIGTVTIYAAMCILDYHEYEVAEWFGWQEKEKTRQKKTRAEVEASAKAERDSASA